MRDEGPFVRITTHQQPAASSIPAHSVNQKVCSPQPYYIF